MASKFTVPNFFDSLKSYEAEIRAEFKGTKPEIRKTLLNILGRGFTLLISGNYIWLQNISEVPFIATCPVEFIPNHGDQEGVPQKPALGAVGNAVATGVNGTLIAIGDRLVSTDTLSLQYEATENATIVAGTATFAVRSLNFGLDTNQAVGLELEFVSPPAGLDTTATVGTGGLDGGADLENVEDWRARILFKKRNPPQGGSLSDYLRWAKEVPEVTRSFAEGKTPAKGDVTVKFMMDNKFVDGIPLQADADAVEAHIKTLYPAQVNLVVPLIVAQPLVVDVAIKPNTPDVQAAVSAAIKDMITREASPGGTIPVTKIGQAISNAEGEFDHLVNSPTANVTTPDTSTIITFADPTFSTLP